MWISRSDNVSFIPQYFNRARFIVHGEANFEPLQKKEKKFANLEYGS